MTTSPSPIAPSPCGSNGASGSSLPRWRLWLSMLNWRRDPDYESKLADVEMRIIDEDLRIAASERRTRQIESDIVRLRSESEQIKKESEQIRQETEQIRQETDLLRRQNAKGRELLASMHALCYPDASNSIPAPSIGTDSAPSSL
jgi:septal ring factor EnvC (AmiA/AmiB activator)